MTFVLNWTTVLHSGRLFPQILFYFQDNNYRYDILLALICIVNFFYHFLKSCWLKKKAQPKSWALYFILGHYLGLSPGKVASQIALGGYSKEVREELGHVGVFAEKKIRNTHVIAHRKITAKHKNQTSQVNDFSAFPCMWRCKILGSLKLLLWFASKLSKVSSLFFSILNSTLRGPLLGWLQRWATFIVYWNFIFVNSVDNQQNNKPSPDLQPLLISLV